MLTRLSLGTILSGPIPGRSHCGFAFLFFASIHYYLGIYPSILEGAFFIIGSVEVADLVSDIDPEKTPASSQGLAGTARLLDKLDVLFFILFSRRDLPKGCWKARQRSTVLSARNNHIQLHSPLPMLDVSEKTHSAA